MSTQIEQNIKQLHIGQIIKNYRELCNLLGLPIKGGDAKKAQLKDIKQYCKLDKDGNKFIISDIYDNPIPKIDNRINNGQSENSHGNNSIEYMDKIEELLLHVIACNDDGHIKITATQLMLQMGFCNENIKEVTTDPDTVSKEYNYKIGELLECADNINLMLRNRLKSALDNLVAANMITYKKIIMLYNKEEKELVEATEEQIILIDKCKNQALDKFNCANMYEVFFKRKNILFFKNYYNLIQENTGYDMSFTMMDINVTDISKLCLYYSDTAVEDTYYINKSIIDNILRNANRRHDKANDTDIYAPENQYKQVKIGYRKSAEYIQNYEKFCDDFINYSDDTLRPI